ncbi:hypothetical protein BH11ACT7_BH11ACT7_02370 [soil metagenome]
MAQGTAAHQDIELKARARNGLRFKPAMAVFAVLLVVAVAAIAVPSAAELTDEPQDSSPAVQKVGSQRLVFAHYFPPYPISLDNADPNSDHYASVYLNPTRTDDPYAPFGAMLRDRPLPRPPRAELDWRESDLATEVRQAISAGIDGFAVDILSPVEQGEWVAAVPSQLLRVAEEIGAPFKIMLMPDMHAELGRLSPGQLADQMARLGRSPAAFRLEDGRLVISPFKAENRSPPWWQDFLAQMKSRHGIEVALLPVFVDDNPVFLDSYASVSFGMSLWGGRNPAFNPVGGFPFDMIARAHEAGKLWMQPVSMQDYRPATQVFDESENTTNLRNTWRIAIEGGAEWVQIATWNDYSESTDIAPSVQHGTALLELTAYYIHLFKHSDPPVFPFDRLFLSHRTQRLDAGPYPEQTALAALRAGSVAGRDTVEALSILTKPSTVVIRVGAEETICQQPAGLSLCLAPLGQSTGQDISVQARVHRAGRTVIDMTSPFPVLARPVIQDLSYVLSQARSIGG